MTRRKTKQQDSAFYVPDGDAGSVWVFIPDDDDLFPPSVWDNEQTAKQYGEAIAKQYNLPYALHPTKMRISTKMKDISS